MEWRLGRRLQAVTYRGREVVAMCGALGYVSQKEYFARDEGVNKGVEAVVVVAGCRLHEIVL